MRKHTYKIKISIPRPHSYKIPKIKSSLFFKKSYSSQQQIITLKYIHSLKAPHYFHCYIPLLSHHPLSLLSSLRTRIAHKTLHELASTTLLTWSHQCDTHSHCVLATLDSLVLLQHSKHITLAVPSAW